MPYQAYQPFILLYEEDYEDVRAYMGVNPNFDSDQFPSSRIQGRAFLGKAELHVKKLVAQQNARNSLVPLAEDIMSGSDEDAKDALKEAVICYIGHLYAVGITNAVNTSETTSTLTQSTTTDLGGVGLSWIQFREKALADCDASLKDIPDWEPFLILNNS